MMCGNIVNFSTVVVLIFAFSLCIADAVKPSHNRTRTRIQTAKLKFKLSARNLIDKDGFTTTDGYVEVYYTAKAHGPIHAGMRLLGRTEIRFDKRNPDWDRIFEFDFDRKLRQYWYFIVYDSDIALDDTVGRVWVNVADYVDKNQVEHANLDKGGYLTVRSASQPKSAKLPTGILPFRRGTPKSKRIKFKVAVRSLSKNVNNHETLVVTVAEGVNGGEKHVGKSTTVTAGFNPSWDQVFTVDWNKSKDQRLHFKVYDGTSNNYKETEKVADGWIQVNDYIAKNESFTLQLPIKGTLAMTKVK